MARCGGSEKLNYFYGSVQRQNKQANINMRGREVHEIQEDETNGE